MNWLDAILRFFRPSPSGVVAKERLRLVLLSDRINLAPEVVDQLRVDLIATISRYMEIDEVGLDVTFETRENDVALLANIPIKAIRARPLPPTIPVAESVTHDEATGAVDLGGNGCSGSDSDGGSSAGDVRSSEGSEVAASHEKTLASTGPRRKRKPKI